MSRLSLTPVNLQYLSAAPSGPTLQAGDTYYNTTLGGLQIYTGSSWVSAGTGSTTSALIFTGFDGGTSSTTVFDLTLDLGAAA